MAAEYHFHGDLSNLLRHRWRDINPIVQPVNRAASIKDVIESFGLPHTEVDRIECDGQAVDFSLLVQDNYSFDIFPVPVPWDVSKPTLLRPDPISEIRFIVDANVGRMARYLRMAGIDTLYNYRWCDEEILDELGLDNRILLTRDLGLLKRKQVVFGRYIRSTEPVLQLKEVIDLFKGAELIKPFTRCLECNALLQPVRKKDILVRLEPLTKCYYESFSICTVCDKIYWPGSHVEKMQKNFPDFFMENQSS